MSMKRLSESQHTRHPPRIAIRGGVSSAANTLSLATHVGSLVNNHMAKHARFGVAHLRMFVTAAPHALSGIAHVSRLVARATVCFVDGKLVGLLGSQNLPQNNIQHMAFLHPHCNIPNPSHNIALRITFTHQT